MSKHHSRITRNDEGSPAAALVDRPNTRRRSRRILVRVLMVIVLSLVVYGGYVISVVSKISSQPFGLSGLAADASGRTNVLVLGEGDPGHAGEGLTDTIMVISYDAHSNRIAQISLPRDMRVSVPGYGQMKINAANALGGTTLAAQVVSNTLDIPIHYVISSNFSGLQAMVDAVGGIEVNVVAELSDTEYPCDDNQYAVCGLDIKPGQTHMDGALALKYVRCRKGTCGNDFGRAARQQEVIGLLRAKVISAETILNPSRLTAVAQAVHRGISTDMNLLSLAVFGIDLNRAQRNDPVHLVLSTASGGYLADAPGSSDLIPIGGSYQAIASRSKDIFSAQ